MLKRYLTGYYGILQIIHLMILGRASVIYAQSKVLPFPASSPPQGWSPQVIPFLFGLGAVDALAAGLGVFWAASILLTHKRVDNLWGQVSLCTAISSALVFAVGTIVTGAWLNHPREYYGMAVAFMPVVLLFFMTMFTEDLR
ncbi:MAG: hypothetical protein R6U51_11620 [Anaerolineales bacterium]